jgi:hypothetical protein
MAKNKIEEAINNIRFNLLIVRSLLPKNYKNIKGLHLSRTSRQNI